MGSATIYSNSDSTIFVVDIPTSIKEAQGTEGSQDPGDLRSCEPRATPFEVNEPKTERARRKVANFGHDIAYHTQLFEHIADALHQVACQRNASDPFHWPRSNVAHLIRKRKRTRDQVSYDEDQGPRALSVDNVGDELQEMSGGRQPLVFAEDQEPFDGIFENELDTAAMLSLFSPQARRSLRFRLPPRSSFVLSDCEQASSFRQAAKEYSAGPVPRRGTFDMILLDPPWPNKSAGRKSDYLCAANYSSIRDILLGIDLDMCIASSGYVAIWITNNPNVRDLVLGPSGLFESWNVSLVEEWIWLKITTNGEPITLLQSVWRKPYEVLLIGKSPADRLTAVATSCEEPIQRRVLLAVPDLHSRKPCLKSLFEKTLLHEQAQSYKALEVFARYLVTGWMSWGDEVLKFNELTQWSLS